MMIRICNISENPPITFPVVLGKKPWIIISDVLTFFSLLEIFGHFNHCLLNGILAFMSQCTSILVYTQSLSENILSSHQK